MRDMRRSQFTRTWSSQRTARSNCVLSRLSANHPDRKGERSQEAGQCGADDGRNGFPAELHQQVHARSHRGRGNRKQEQAFRDVERVL